MGALRMEVVRDLDALDAHARAWDELAARTPPFRPTHAHAWVRAFLGHRVAPQSWQCALAFRDDQLVGVLPLHRRGRTLRTLRDDHTPTGDAVVEPAQSEDILAALVRAHREGAPGADTIAFEGLVPGSPTRTWLAGLSEPVLHRRAWMTGATIDTTAPYAERLAALSGNTRSKLRKGERLLAEHGEVTFHAATAPGELAAAFTVFQEVEAATWKGRQGTAIAQHDALRNFYGELVDRLGASGGVRFHTLRAGATPVACEMIVTCGPSAVVHKVAYDETHKKASPGNLIWARTLQWACDDADIQHVDLLAMDELMARWGAKPYDYASALLFRRGLWPMLRARWPAQLRARLAALRQRGS